MIRVACVLLVAAGVVVLAGRAGAEVFRYVDERGTAHYVDGLDSVPERFRATAVPLGLRNAPAPPAAPAGATSAAPAAGVTTIRYRPGQRIMVDVRINGGATAQLLLDTGADRTMISPRVLVAAGASPSRVLGSAQVQGVAGSDRVPFVEVSSLEVGQARVGRMAVGSYEVGGAGDGLLGRDFLDQFTVTIDSSAGILTLAPR